jgi:hypothetical protein
VRRGEKGVKGAKAKGWVSFWQTIDRGGWEFVTTSKEAGSPSNNTGVFYNSRVSFFKKCCIFVNIKYIFCEYI